MMRVIVELSVSSPKALNLSGATEGAALRNKIVAMLKYLDPEIENPAKRDKELTQAFLEASELGIHRSRVEMGIERVPVSFPDGQVSDQLGTCGSLLAFATRSSTPA
jgi:hypothetical protein